MLQFPLLSELRNVHSNLIKIFKLLSHLAIINEQMHFANKSKILFYILFTYWLNYFSHNFVRMRDIGGILKSLFENHLVCLCLDSSFT